MPNCENCACFNVYKARQAKARVKQIRQQQLEELDGNQIVKLNTQIDQVLRQCCTRGLRATTHCTGWEMRASSGGWFSNN